MPRALIGQRNASLLPGNSLQEVNGCGTLEKNSFGDRQTDLCSSPFRPCDITPPLGFFIRSVGVVVLIYPIGIL